MGLDGLVGVDGLVAHGDVDVAVPGDDLGDVRGEAVEDGVGDEHAAEVVRGVAQWLPAGLVRPASGDGGGEHAADGPGGSLVRAAAALEQQRGRWQPAALVVVVGGDEGDAPAGARTRLMMAARTSARSGLISSSRSVSVLDGVIWRRGTSSPVPGGGTG